MTLWQLNSCGVTFKGSRELRFMIFKLHFATKSQDALLSILIRPVVER
jgi:hypothetical protein